MEKISFENIEITGGFWKEKQDMVKNTTLWAVYDRFKETGRFDAFLCNWKEGMEHKPHVFWDSDVAKWIEGAAYILKKERNPKLEEIIDGVVDLIEKNADENGYYNSHFMVMDQDKKLCSRNEHELYCLGHLIEGAIAYKNATGKDKFLKLMCEYTDYVEKVFKIEKTALFVTPGHPELELALVKLYEEMEEKRYLELAEFFVYEHGNGKDSQPLYWNTKDSYNQDECLLKDRTTIDGHSVRALYLYTGVADVVKHNGNRALMDACRRIFDNAVNKRMYITGGVGSSVHGEAFTVDYDLPNRTAYAETCAALALAFFAERFSNLEPDSRYADVVEKTIYNGFLSGVSMDGKSFFYENPLEIDADFNNVDQCTTNGKRYPITQRVEVFECSCCPPNVVRFIPSVANFMYGDAEDTLYVHQYMESEMEKDGVSVVQKTDYPANGLVKLFCDLKGKKLALRIPGWCKSFSLNVPYVMKNGYAIVENATEIEFLMDMPVVCMRANNKVHEDAGKIAVMRGPVVYCAEGIDNGTDVAGIHIEPKGDFELAEGTFLLPDIKTTGYKMPDTDKLYCEAEDEWIEVPVTLIPYYAFANRGETDMYVWLLRK